MGLIETCQIMKSGKICPFSIFPDPKIYEKNFQSKNFLQIYLLLIEKLFMNKTKLSGVNDEA